MRRRVVHVMTRVSRTARIWIALWTVYILWGSTYLGIELAAETMPPFFAAGTRFLIVGLLMLAVRERPDLVSTAGVVLGFVGISVLVKPGGSSGSLGYLLITVLASFLWAFGSFLSPRLPVPSDAFAATAYEMLAGGVVLMTAALIAYSPSQLSPVHYSLR